MRKLCTRFSSILIPECVFFALSKKNESHKDWAHAIELLILRHHFQ